MEFAFPQTADAALAAPFLQTALTVGLVALCIFLYQRYRKRYFLYWALAWTMYALRLGAILTFLSTGERIWLYWHQVATGWTALGILWAAVVFSQQLPLRRHYLVLVVFPPIWSYIAIYQLENFFLAAGPAVAFLSGATVWTGWVFLQHRRQVGSWAAAMLAATMMLWGLHHLDYPFFRARGTWNPWGYYLDIVFELAVGAGILLLVLEDLHGGLRTLSTLSSDLQRGGEPKDRPGVLEALLERPLTLPAVRGSALFTESPPPGRYVGGAGACADWTGTSPSGQAEAAITRSIDTGQPEIVHGLEGHGSEEASGHSYFASLPVLHGDTAVGALIMVGDARDPFAALDTKFLTALGQQVGAALENADLYRSLAARTTELEDLTTRMLHQYEGERRRLSRELHDETAQVLSAVKLQLGLVRERASEEQVPRIDRVLELVDTGIQSIRNVTDVLRPPLLDELGLVQTVRALTEDFGDQSGLQIRLRCPSHLPSLGEDAELAIFRAVQEGLANVGRHAGANSAVVTLAEDDGWIRVSVRDDGRGIPAGQEFEELERKGHMGLTGMRERILALGGTVSIFTPPEGGAVLDVRLPCDENEEAR
jgi:signal transduction histidine kinase